MSPDKPHAPVTNEAVEDLVRCITEAADQIAVLREAIDELRVDFSWAVQNKRLSRGACPVLKRMAADPTAADWRERLEIVRESNESNPHPVDPHHVPPIVDQLLAGAEEVLSCLINVRDSLSQQFSATKRPSPDENVKMRASSEDTTGQQTSPDGPEAEPSSIEVVCPGDPVDFVHDGHGCFDEVLRIDHAAGTADVYHSKRERSWFACCGIQ